MEAIITAILDRGQQTLRRLLRDDPGLKDFRTSTGTTIFQLAEKSGNSLIEACVLRETGTPAADQAALLYGILATVSQEYFCAQYESSIEYSLWHCLENGGDWPAHLEDLYQPLDAETLRDIRYVVDQTGSWYLDGHGIIPLSRWKREYETNGP